MSRKHDRDKPIRGDLATEIRDPKRTDIGTIGIRMVEAARLSATGRKAEPKVAR